MENSAQPKVIFVADTHFHLEPDAAEKQRLARFLELLEAVRRADDLVLLGDIFDFWFDYPHFRLRGYVELLAGLDAVRDAGVRIHFIGGNHDIWAADYMCERYGCEMRGESDVLRFGDRRVKLCHGDGLFKFDWAYNGFRAVVRNRAGILAAKSLHPEILFALSTWLSGRSRAATRDEAATIERRAARWLRRHADGTWDLMVMGHVHHGFSAEHEGATLATLPGWLGVLGYGVLAEGRFRLCDAARDGLPRF